MPECPAERCGRYACATISKANIAVFESFLITFPAVALAELGDKTQLLVLMLAARFRRPGAVLLGLIAGSAINAGLAVAGGSFLDRLVPEHWLNLIIAIAFVGIGLWMVLNNNSDGEDEIPPAAARGAFLATLWLFVVMELGDKTQLATLGLAAGMDNLAGVFAGGMLGLLVANLPALWLGQRFADSLPRALLHRIGGALFILIGSALIVIGR